MMKKIGETLVEKYDGRFHNFFEANKKDVFSLIEAMAREFAGFADVALYKGKEVLFYKKAQLVMTDISNNVEEIPLLDELNGMADYKIPAILRQRGVLKYSPGLSQKVDNRVEIPLGTEPEVEIRANLLWACDQIVEKLKTRGIKINACDYENILWIESQDKSKLSKPYHLTKTVFY